MKQILSLLGAACLLSATASAQGADDCSGAQPISGYNLFAFDNTSATASGISDCNGIAVRKDVWFSWVAPATEQVRFETCNTNTGFDTRIVAYDGLDCGNLQLLACAAQSCMGLSSVTFNAVAGNSYLIRVGSRAVGTGGPGEFRLRQEPCPATNDDNFEDNDNCMEATQLADGNYSGLWCSKQDPDWYEFAVPPGGTITMDVLFNTADGDIDIFGFVGCGAGQIGAGIGGSASNDEQLVYTNGTAATENFFLRVELWPDDPTEDCNDYTMVLTTTGGSNVGTTYCMANANSTGVSAEIFGLGSEIVSDNALVLGATQLPTFAFAFFIVSQTQGFAQNPGGSSGNLCLSGGVGRYVGMGQIQQSNSAGEISLGVDLTQIPQPNGFVAAASGETWNFQAWYRDSSPAGPTSNFTNGLEVTFQ